MRSFFQFTRKLLKNPVTYKTQHRAIWNWRVGWLFKPYPQKGRLSIIRQIQFNALGFVICMPIWHALAEYGILPPIACFWDEELRLEWQTQKAKFFEAEKEKQEMNEKIVALAKKREENAKKKLDDNFNINLPVWPPPWK